MKTVCIIQARMGSERLPGKVLLPLAGKPMLARVVERCRKASTIDEVVVATTTQAADDAIVSLAESSGWGIFRGDPFDLTDRYYNCAIAHAADVVVRVTSDCPLIDPDIIDEIVTTLGDDGGYDYASNTIPPRMFPRGLDVEAFTIAALERAWREDPDPAWREHATPYIYWHPESFKIKTVGSDVDRSSYRWTVDTADDFRLIKEIYNALGDEPFNWRDVLRLCEAHPEWLEYNRHVQQKTL